MGKEAAYAVRLAIEELISNVIRHGYDDQHLHEIRLSVRIRAGFVELGIEDDAKPFDPHSGPSLPIPSSLEEAPTGGMGLALVREMAGSILYQRIRGRNRVTVRIPK